MQAPDDRRLLTGVAVAWLAAGVAAFVDAGPWSLHVRLTIGGVALESVGIALLALDIVADPVLLAVGRVAAVSKRAIEALLTSLRTPEEIVVNVGSAELGLHGGDVVVSSTSNVRSIEDEVAYLRAELVQLRNQVADTDARVGRDLRDLRSDLLRTRDDLQRSISRAIEESKREYYEWRLGGFAIALAGSGLLAWANLA